MTPHEAREKAEAEVERLRALAPDRGRRPVVYLAHPVGATTSDGVRANLARAKRWLWALRCATDWSICAPWIPTVEAVLDSGADGVRANLARAKRWLWALRCATDWSICAPWIPTVEAVLDSGADEGAERARGLADDLAVVERCGAIVGCGGRWSSGMTAERSAARSVIDLTDMGEEPPDAEILRVRCEREAAEPGEERK
jgi:hypothetical protein